MAKAESYEATDITASATSSGAPTPAKSKGGNPLKRLWSTRSGRAVLAVGVAGIMLLMVLVKRGSATGEPADAAAAATDAAGAAPTDMALDLGPTIPTTPIPSGGFQFQDYGDSGYPPAIPAEPTQPLPPVQVIIQPTSPSAGIAGNGGSATGSPGVAAPPPVQEPVAPVSAPPPSSGVPQPPAKAQEIARWTPPANIKVGGPTDISGATFAGRVKLSNGQYAPIIRYGNGTSQIHPSWQRWMAANKVTKA